jgi:LacI family transcriptional regulator
VNKRLLNVTLRSVASRAGVHPSTVSRVLAGKPDVRVSRGTRNKILKAASELNYHPNTIARSLKVRKTFTISVFIPDVGNPVYPEMIHGIEDATAEMGYHVLFNHMTERSIINKLYLRLLGENRVDGLLIATTRTEDSVIQELIDRQCNFVLINRRTTATNNYVAVDDAAGARIAMNHLVELGHRRIAHLAGPLIFDTALLRLQGYRQTLAKHGLSYDSALVEEIDWFSWGSAKEAISRFIEKEDRPTSVFAGNLLAGIGAISALNDLGLKVPEDMSVISLHDAPIAEVITPPMTVVKMPLYEMGYEGAKALIHIINGREVKVPQVMPPKNLIIRNSTAPPRT